MLVASAGVAATGTFAWYTASPAVAKESVAATGAVGVAQATEDLNGVVINVAVTTGFVDSLIYTNRTGRAYQRSGANYVEVASSDTGSALGTNKKQASTTFDVKITTTAGGTTAPDAVALGSVAGDYFVRVTASGKAKIALTQTTVLGDDESGTVVNGADPADSSLEAAEGALGAALAQTVSVMKININASGVVKYWTNPTAEPAWDGAGTTWATVSSTVQTAAVFYGLEVDSADGQSSASIASNYTTYDSKLTPKVVATTEGGSELDPAS